MAYGTEHEHEEILRHALRAAGDSIQPAADGLDRISHRLTKPRPLPVALAIGGFDWLHRSLTVTVPCAAEQAWVAMLPARKQTRRALTWMIAQASSQARRPVAADGGGHARPSGRLVFGRLRPVAAMFVAIFVVAAAGYVFFALPRAMSPGQAIGLLFPTPAKHGSGHGHHRSGGSGASGSSGTQPSSGTGNTSTNGGVNCSHPGKSGSSTPASTNPSTAPSSSASPSPSTSTTSPSPSTSTSTSPSPSSTPSAGSSGTPGSGSGGTTTPSTTRGKTSSDAHRQVNPDKAAGDSAKRRKHHRHAKTSQSCGTTTAYLVPAAGSGQRGSLAVLAAAQLTALSRDPADAAAL